MLVEEVNVDAKTGEVTRRMVEVPDMLTTQQATARQAAEVQAESNEKTILQQAADALAGNTAFLNIASPSNAQTLAQVKALTRQNNKIIRMLLRKFDATD